MTDKEKAIVMAHTGICMLTGEKYGVFHAYIEGIMGRPVYTHELAMQSISDEIKEKSRDDFIKLCMEEQEPSENAVSRQAVLDKKELVELEDGQSFYCISPEDVETLPPVTPQPHWIPDMRVTAEEAAEAIQNLTKAGISQEDIGSSDLPLYDPDRKRPSLGQIKEYIVDILKEEYERGYRDGKAEREVIEDDLK